MKRMITLAATVLASAAIMLAGPVTIEWDHNPPEDVVTEYRIYEVQGTNYVLSTSVAGDTNQVTFEVLPGPRTFVATAVNAVGESPYSDPASTVINPNAPPGAPQNIRLVLP